MWCVLVFLCAVVNVVEDSLQGSFSFRSVGLRDQTQVVGLACMLVETSHVLLHAFPWLYIKQVFEV